MFTGIDGAYIETPRCSCRFIAATACVYALEGIAGVVAAVVSIIPDGIVINSFVNRNIRRLGGINPAIVGACWPIRTRLFA